MVVTFQNIARSAVLLLAIGVIANPLGSVVPSAHAQETGGETADIAAQIQAAVDALGPDATSEQKAAAAQQAGVALASSGADGVAGSQALAAVVNVPVESAAQAVVSALPPEQQESAKAALAEAGVEVSTDTNSESSDVAGEEAVEEEAADDDTAEPESVDDGSDADVADGDVVDSAGDTGEAAAEVAGAPTSPPEAPAPPPAGGNAIESGEEVDPEDLPPLPPEVSPST